MRPPSSLTAQIFAPNQLALEATSTKMCLRPPQTLAQEPRGPPRDLQKRWEIKMCSFFLRLLFFLFFFLLHIYAVNDCSMKFNVQVYFLTTVGEVCWRSFFCLSRTEGKSSQAAIFTLEDLRSVPFPLMLCQTKWILISPDKRDQFIMII